MKFPTWFSENHIRMKRALGTLRGTRRVPFVRQLANSDCGAAALTSVMRFFDIDVSLNEIRDAVGSGRDGTSALQISRVASHYGLLCQAVRVEIDDLDALPPATILHWNMDHFVVLEKVDSGTATIVDPAIGRTHVPRKDIDRSLTGTALCFQNSDSGRPVRRLPYSSLRIFLRGAILRAKVLPRIIALSVVLQLVATISPVLTGFTVDHVIKNNNPAMLHVVGAGFFSFVLLILISTYIRSYYLLDFRTHLDRDLATHVINHMFALPFSFFQNRQVGDISTRLSSSTTIRDSVSTAILSTFLDGVVSAAYLAVLFSIDAGMGCVAITFAAARAVVALVTASRMSELIADYVAAQSSVATLQYQMIGGVEILKSSGGQKHLLNCWADGFNDMTQISVKKGKLEARIQAVYATIASAAPLALLWYGATQVIGGHLSLGTLMASIGLGLGFLVPFSSLVGSVQRLHMLRGYAERVDDVLFEEPDHQAGNSRHAVSGDIRLKNVSFRYSSSGPWILQDLSLHIKAGQKVGIVGRSGSGKTTIARLLVRLHEPTAGSIMYDGLDVNEIDVQDLRTQIGFVSQDHSIFFGTIRFNIVFASQGVSEEDLFRAAKFAGIAEDIKRMPLGYETVVDSGGSTLSAGQRQRISLARACIGNPRILVLDEVTSNVDSITERAMQENAAALKCTRIFISHRLSTVIGADQIFVVDDGIVVESGCHSDLLDAGGLYYELFYEQARPGSDLDQPRSVPKLERRITQPPENSI